jgi:hypothetical protein
VPPGEYILTVKGTLQANEDENAEATITFTVQDICNPPEEFTAADSSEYTYYLDGEDWSQDAKKFTVKP